MEVLIDIIDNHIKLIGISTLKRRLKTSLKRLNYVQEEEFIIIPFGTNEKENILREIIKLLDKFEITHNLTDSLKEEVSSFNRENEQFEEFSSKAKKIRNNEFDDNEELIEEFKCFKSVLENKMTRRLYDFQFLSSYHLAFSQNACNFAVPGAGKTSIVYGAYTYLKSLEEDDEKRVDKLMIIGPLASFAPWENEYEACYGKKVRSQRISGEVPRELRKEHLYSGNPAELTIISHAGVTSLEHEIKDFLKRNKTMVVVDEAHRIKNPTGIWANSILEISKEAKSRVILTGTPLPNGYQDLFNLYKFIYPYKYKEILRVHVNNLIEMTDKESLGSSRIRRFIENISPYFIRIKKDDLRLPPVKETEIKVQMDDVQGKIYKFIESKYVSYFKKDSSASVKDILNKARLIRLRQAATNPSLLLKPLKGAIDCSDSSIDNVRTENDISYEQYIDDSEVIRDIVDFKKSIPSKFLKVKEILEEKIFIKNGKAIIWTIFIQNARELKKFLMSNNINTKLLIGEVTQEEREVIISKFNDPVNNEFSVVIANPFAVSESISLHKGCHNAIYLERDYNCAMFLQSKDRIHRVGLDKNQETNYYYILAKDTIDGVINTKLNEKAERMSRVIDDDIPLFNRLNDDDETDLIKALLEDYAKRS